MARVHRVKKKERHRSEGRKKREQPHGVAKKDLSLLGTEPARDDNQ